MSKLSSSVDIVLDVEHVVLRRHDFDGVAEVEEVLGHVDEFRDVVLDLAVWELANLHLLLLEFRLACLISGWRATSQTPPIVNFGPASILDALIYVLVARHLQELLDRVQPVVYFLVHLDLLQLVLQIGEGSAVARASRGTWRAEDVHVDRVPEYGMRRS